MTKKIIILIAIILIFGLILSACNLNIDQNKESVYIERVIDGDTVKIASGESIRLIGIDTPELDWENNNSEFYAEAARDYSQKQLLNQKVILEYDQQLEDNYGRKLAYIYHQGINFNQRLLEEGYASVMVVEPNDKYEEKFRAAAERARNEQKGIWNQILVMEKQFPVINYQKAALFVGQQVIIEGEIVNTTLTDSVCYLNFSNDYLSDLSLVIFKHNLNKFSYQPTKYLKNKKVKAFGTIELYKGNPQIIIDDPYDLLVVD